MHVVGFLSGGSNKLLWGLKHMRQWFDVWNSRLQTTVSLNIFATTIFKPQPQIAITDVKKTVTSLAHLLCVQMQLLVNFSIHCQKYK